MLWNPKYPVITVYHPEAGNGHAFANYGWAGFVGSITGFSSAPMVSRPIWLANVRHLFTLSYIFSGCVWESELRIQRNSESHRSPMALPPSWYYAGKLNLEPWPLFIGNRTPSWELNSLIICNLQFDEDINNAIERMEAAARTCAIWVGLGDYTNTFTAFAYSYDKLVLYLPISSDHLHKVISLLYFRASLNFSPFSLYMTGRLSQSMRTTQRWTDWSTLISTLSHLRMHASVHCFKSTMAIWPLRILLDTSYPSTLLVISLWTLSLIKTIMFTLPFLCFVHIYYRRHASCDLRFCTQRNLCVQRLSCSKCSACLQPSLLQARHGQALWREVLSFCRVLFLKIFFFLQYGIKYCYILSFLEILGNWCQVGLVCLFVPSTKEDNPWCLSTNQLILVLEYWVGEDE